MRRRAMRNGIAREVVLWLLLGLGILLALLVIVGKSGDVANKILELLNLRVG